MTFSLSFQRGLFVIVLLCQMTRANIVQQNDVGPKSDSVQGQCSQNTDCGETYLICEEGICVHKSIFPIYQAEFAGFLILPTLVGLANVAGIGGGGITVPIVMICWGFNTKESVAISSATIFVGSVVRFFYSIDRKHPEKKATSIDYGIVIVMLPLVLVGAFTGVLVNIVLPPIILSTILTLLLLYLTFTSLQSAIKIWRKETEQILKEEKELEEDPYLKRKQTLHAIEDYDRDRLEREKFMPDVRYLHEEREILNRSRSLKDIYFIQTSSEEEDENINL